MKWLILLIPYLCFAQVEKFVSSDTLAFDSFITSSGDDNTDLDDDTLEVGGLIWDKVIDTDPTTAKLLRNDPFDYVDGNNQTPISGFTDYWIDIEDSDVKISVSWETTNITTYGRLLLRWEDENTHLALEAKNGSPDTLTLKKVNADIDTVLIGASASFSNGSAYKLTAILEGDSIKCYLDDVLQFVYRTNFNNTETKFGMAVHRQEIYDNFLVLKMTPLLAQRRKYQVK